MITEIPEEKFCPKCQTTKSVSEFNRNKLQKDGLQYACRTCIRNYKSDKTNLNFDGYTKPCEGCTRTLPREAFSYAQHSPDRLRSTCLTCSQHRAGPATMTQAIMFEQEMQTIYAECKELVADPETQRCEFERLVYRAMGERGLLEHWKPPVWIHSTSME